MSEFLDLSVHEIRELALRRTYPQMRAILAELDDV